MNATSTSLRAFGLYMIIIPGLGLMLMPEFILDLFGLNHGSSLWLARMVGLLACIIGIFDLLIAKHQLKEVYKATVVLRYFAALFMIFLLMIGEVEIMILLFAAIDALGATWTLWTLRKTAAT